MYFRRRVLVGEIEGRKRVNARWGEAADQNFSETIRLPDCPLTSLPPKAWMNDIHCAGEAGWQSASKATVDSIIFLAIPIAA